MSFTSNRFFVEDRTILRHIAHFNIIEKKKKKNRGRCYSCEAFFVDIKMKDVVISLTPHPPQNHVDANNMGAHEIWMAPPFEPNLAILPTPFYLQLHWRQVPSPESFCTLESSASQVLCTGSSVYAKHFALSVHAVCVNIPIGLCAF